MPTDAQGNPAPEPGQGGATSQLTEEQVVKLINSAFTARGKDLEKKLTTTMQDALGTLTTKLEELAQRAPTPPDPKAGAQPVDVENHPAFKGLQRQLAETVAKQRAAEESAKAARSKERDSALRTTAATKLADAGIDGTRARAALAMLIDAGHAIRYADDDGDEIVFADKEGPVDLETGLKSWLKSDDAKLFLPPRGAVGSGDRGGGRPPAGTPPGTLQRGDIGRALIREFVGGPVE
jgi:hypothetical protein